VGRFGDTVRRSDRELKQEVESGDERNQIERELVGGLEEPAVQENSRS
jgi:hypothetical protein